MLGCVLVMSGIIAGFRVFFDSHQGGRQYMEDVVSVMSDSEPRLADRGFASFAVYDGHGGLEAANFAKIHLVHQISRRAGFDSQKESDVVQAIKEAFISTHKMMTTVVENWPKTDRGFPSTAGTTASVAILLNNKLYVAHVGDSSVVIAERVPRRPDGMFKAIFITEDHKPDNDKERRRIESCGGEVLMKDGVARVVWNRPRLVDGPRLRRPPVDKIRFLAVARSLGDLWSYNRQRDIYIVSPEPDVAVFNIDGRQQRCLVIASDGVWNVMSPTDATDYISRWNRRSQRATVNYGNDDALRQPAAGLVQLALDRWSLRGIEADNISVIVVMFSDPAEQRNDVLEPTIAGQETSSGFSRSSRLRYALRKLWRARPATRLLSRARGMLGLGRLLHRQQLSTDGQCRTSPVYRHRHCNRNYMATN